MNSSCITPSWGRVACATAAAVSFFYPLGMAAALIWAHVFVAFGAVMLLALVSMQFHPRSRRVAGVPVNQDRITAS